MIWPYIENKPNGLFKEMNSSRLDIKTTLAPYISKKGVASMAHYTTNGYYVGSVKQLGNQPCYYDGNFKINREQFKLNIDILDRLVTLNGEYALHLLFEPIKPSTKPSVKQNNKKLIIEEDLD